MVYGRTPDVLSSEKYVEGNTMNAKSNLVVPAIFLLILYAAYLFSFRNIQRFGEQPTPHSDVILTVRCHGGRLGNHMSLYAVLLGLSRLNGRVPVIPDCLATEITAIFEIKIQIKEFPTDRWHGHFIGWTFNPASDANISTESNILTGNSYPDSYTFFDFARSEILREFIFKPSLVKFARDTLQRAVEKRNKHSTFVGVHVRRGDYLRQLSYMNRRVAGQQYFKLAFNYYRQRFRYPIFVVTSDDMRWCRTHLTAEDVYFREDPVTAAQDMALLAHCNHSVITYGTFGFWSAYLAGGEAVYMANSTAPGSWFDIDQPETKFFLPNWTGLSEVNSDFWKNYKVIPKMEKFLFS